jgi:hypothetical protein
VEASRELDEVIHGEFKPLDDNGRIDIERHEASLILDGWKAGMKGPEIIEALDIDATEYRTEVRLVRRRIDERWPKGMPHVQ